MVSNAVQIKPNPGPQTAFAASAADIVIYGGQAGGGKTFAIVSEPLRHHQNGQFRAGIFRRTYPQIKGQGGIWDEARGIYPLFGAKMREGQELDARFPSGAVIGFYHLQHEKTKHEYQGHQFAYLGFDELTHFTESQFFYLLSRNRTTCGIRAYCRATCNPDAGSWVASFISWWIDQESGFPIPERSGVLRYFVRCTGEDGKDAIHWADSREAIIERFPEFEAVDILSATFIPAALDDNPALLSKDPGYRGRLKAQPRVERERLEKGNWKASEGALIDSKCFRRFHVAGDQIQLVYQGRGIEIPASKFRRFATIDTAGTSKEKAAESRGDPPSYSCCAIWDHFHHRDKVSAFNVLLLRYMWRDRVGWSDLKTRIPAVLVNWNVRTAIIENAHYGAPLAAEITVCAKKMTGPVLPGMDDTSRGAKLERAIASGLLSRLEDIGIWLPTEGDWIPDYLREMTTWTGLPKETADQIDVSSYAAHECRTGAKGWGGTIR